jgi:hypothetical protein
MKFLGTALFLLSNAALSYPLHQGILSKGSTTVTHSKELNLNLSLPFGEFISTGAWSAPGPNDFRSPCPGLNTLANHGAFPHSGKGLTKDIIVNGLSGVYNLSPFLAGTLFENAALALNLAEVGSSGQREIDLKVIREHGVIEHDASLSRYDYGDAGKDNFTPQEALVTQLKSFAVNGFLDWTGIAKARLLRIQQEQKSDPTFQNGLKESTLAIGECIFVIRILGDGDKIPVQWIDSWFLKEQIPQGWKAPSSQYGLLQIASDAIFFNTCITKVQLGLTC